MSKQEAQPRESLMAQLGQAVEGRKFQNFIVALIVINAVVLGLETWEAAVVRAGPLLAFIDHAILGVFVFEMIVKLATQRLSFFRSGWNVFDFVIVLISAISLGSGFAILRSLRILRILRLISVVPQMRLVVEALIKALPGMGSILGVLILIYYVSAVLAVKLFGGAYPELFGSIGKAMYTLFRTMTLDDWSSEVAEPIMQAFPWAWTFFVTFIILTTFAILNVFIAIVVNALHELTEEELTEIGEAIERAEEKELDIIMGELRSIRAEIEALRQNESTPK